VPDVVLLDAVMPGMDGFEVARRLKADPDTAHIPILFMTGLTDTEHVVAAFGAGGADYVTKPIRPQEVLARMAAHMQSARKAVWQTPLARQLMHAYFAVDPGQVPAELLQWLREQSALADEGREGQPLTVTRTVSQQQRQLVFSLQERTSDDDWLMVLREVSDAAVVEALLQAFKLTMKEAEVLYWVVKGKTNRDIGDILGSSPATVKKHLEHVFEKLGVETRNAAASLAMKKVRMLAG
jgi:DNA-binding NarL/FixJ family response regulator